MKKGKVFLMILLLIVVVLGALAFWQRDNLGILLQAGKYSTQEIETKMNENRQTLQDTLDRHPEISVREPNDEEMQALKKGETTPEELAKELAETEDAFSAELSELLARILLLQELYTGKLEALEAEAKAEYRSMPESDRSKTKLVEWAGGYIKRATAMEKECDAQIDEIAAELLALLKEYDGDTELADQMVFAYAEEKRLKKAWYLSRLEERGLLG